MNPPPILAAAARQPLATPPVWMMRQAGRHLPEYRRLREQWSFVDAVRTPSVAAEITLQPIERYQMDGAVIFADIMTPLEAMGIDIVFDPGPKLTPVTLEEIARLGDLDVAGVGFVAETIRRVASQVPNEVAVIGFAGAPFTLLAYLLEGGGSKDFMEVRAAVRRDPALAEGALHALAVAMRRYLSMQIDAGADIVQLFDSWAGVLGRDMYPMAAAAARAALEGLDAPRIYFAPGAGHTLDLQASIGADVYGVDWRMPPQMAWDRLGDVAIQGNLDPAVLLSDIPTIEAAAEELLESAAGRPGHIVNLGHGIHPKTPPEHVSAFVKRVRA